MRKRDHRLNYKLRAQMEVVREASLIAIAAMKTKEGTYNAVASGFVMESHGFWVWITAGHVISAWNGDEDSPTITSFMLGSPVSDSAQVELEYQPLERYCFRDQFEIARSEWIGGILPQIQQDALQMDLGLVVLPQKVVSHLRDNGVVPFEDKHLPSYANSPLPDHARLYHFLCGSPGSSKVQSVQNVGLAYKALALQPLNASGFNVLFRPRWKAGAHDTSVSGMSGGPIVGLGGRRPLVCAVQCGEIEQLDLLFATDLSIAFREWIAPALAEMARNAREVQGIKSVSKRPMVGYGCSDGCIKLD